jgi:hypothetical protein
LGVVAAELVFWSWLVALGRFFRVGRSCNVLDFNGFPQVVQCAGQAFCVEIYGFSVVFLTDLPTIICIKHNGDNKPEEHYPSFSWHTNFDLEAVKIKQKFFFAQFSSIVQ